MKIKQLLSDFGFRAILLGVVDGIAVLFLIVVLNRLTAAAHDLQKIKIDLAQNIPVSQDAIRSDIEMLKPQIEKLSAFYPNETSVVDFVNQIDEIKNGQVLNSFSFANEVPVKDKTGYLGFPITMSLKGDWIQINETLKKIELLSYFIRPVQVKVTQTADNQILMQYNGFLYVNEKFSKN